jgi:hypothetical protein
MPKIKVWSSILSELLQKNGHLSPISTTALGALRLLLLIQQLPPALLLSIPLLSSHLKAMIKLKAKNSTALVLWTALLFLFDVLILIYSEQIEKHLDVHDLCKDTNIYTLENPISYYMNNTNSSSVFRLAEVCDMDPVLPSGVVLMSTTPKSLMSPSDLVLPTTNNEKVVHKLARVYEIDLVLLDSVIMMSTIFKSLMSPSGLVMSTTNNKKIEHNQNRYKYLFFCKSLRNFMETVVIIFLQPQIDLTARVRLCKLRCIQNQYLH